MARPRPSPPCALVVPLSACRNRSNTYDTVVGDGNLRGAARLLHVNLDTTADRRELHRVREQVPNDLLQAVGIAVNLAGERRDRNSDVDFPRTRRRLHGIDGCEDSGLQVDRLRLDPELPAHGAGHVEQIVDEHRLRAGVSLDALQRTLQRAFVESTALENVGPTQKGVQRRAELV
jgi:hypothetical protein